MPAGALRSLTLLLIMQAAVSKMDWSYLLGTLPPFCSGMLPHRNMPNLMLGFLSASKMKLPAARSRVLLLWLRPHRKMGLERGSGYVDMVWSLIAMFCGAGAPAK
jgi:hypothetical protein